MSAMVQIMNVYECNGTINFMKQNETHPLCLVKIYFAATAGNCGLIIHG